MPPSLRSYGERLPFDHHEVVAAIAPRAVIIANTNDDYADNAEGDAIGYEGAKPVYAFFGAPQNLALDIYLGGGGHSLKPSQAANIVTFANMVLFGRPLSDDVKKQLTTDPYLDAGTYDTYYGGLKTMMPWAGVSGAPATEGARCEPTSRPPGTAGERSPPGPRARRATRVRSRASRSPSR